MDPLLVTAASGMKARMESLDLLANNIANSGTNAFKTDQEFYTTFRQELPLIETRWTDFRQGSILPSDNPLDLALDGPGFLAVNAPAGTIYTRNAALQLNAAHQMITADGYTVRNQRDSGKPIAIDPDKPVAIDRAGVVRQNSQEVGQMELVGFANSTQALSKLGTSYFALTGQEPPGKAPDAVIRQGAVEQSNVPAAGAAVRLVDVMRQFEMLQRAMSIGAEMNKRALDEVARGS